MSVQITGHDVGRDAQRVFDVICGGGVAIIHLDVAYAILGRTEAAVRRIYAAKERSFAKPTGIVGNLALHRELHVLGEREWEIVRAITQDHDLPLAVIAPYRRDHPFLRKLEPFVLDNATRDGTLNILINAGELRDRIAALSIERDTPVVGSSANASLTGSKFRLQDVDPAVRAIADIEVDYGLSKYHNPEGRSSTMIDFRSFGVVRRGVCFGEISAILRRDFGVELARAAA
ncbi:MAG: Sua5/YciO/YrdC/YwlC family protein [Betaproteobacteria bacterium]|nr:Sua5/YciO/YrdC/YwlC family protein [Betaproteobacteria bacterium]